VVAWSVLVACFVLVVLVYKRQRTHTIPRPPIRSLRLHAALTCPCRAGVVLYVVLAAFPPFKESALELAREHVTYNFLAPVWRTVSATAKVGALRCRDFTFSASRCR
jgi:hypothetical protein